MALVRKALGNPKLRPHPEWRDFQVADVGPHIVNLGVTGMGRDARAELTDYFMPSPLAGALMIGFGGGLDPQLPIGFLCLSQEVRSTLAAKPWPGSAAMLERGMKLLKDHSLPGGNCRVLTVDDVIHSPGTKAALFKRYAAHVVDMETAGFAAACRNAGVRWLAVRAVFDPADEFLPQVQALAEATGASLAVELLRLMVTRPLVSLTLPKLAFRASAVGKRLIAFVRAWFEDLPESTVKIPRSDGEPLPWDSTPGLPDPLDF